MYQEPRSFGTLLAVIAALAIGCTAETDNTAQKPTVIAMLPKLTNIEYFDACHRGAQTAAEDLGVRLIYDGPREPSGSEQNKFIESWIRQGVNAICVAPNQPKSIKNFVRRAQQRGIKVLTWAFRHAFNTNLSSGGLIHRQLCGSNVSSTSDCGHGLPLLSRGPRWKI